MAITHLQTGMRPEVMGKQDSTAMINHLSHIFFYTCWTQGVALRAIGHVHAWYSSVSVRCLAVSRFQAKKLHFSGMSYLPNPEEAIPHKFDQIRSLRYQNYQPGAVFLWWKIDFLGASKLSPLGMTEQACLSFCSRSLPASWMHRGKNGCKVLPGKYLCVCLWHLKQAKNTDGTNLLSTNFTIQDDRIYPLVI